MEPSKIPRTPGAGMAAATCAAMIAQQVAGKASRDALFLSSFHATSLPWVMVAAAVLSLAGVLGVSRVMARYSPALVTPALFGASACAFVLEWILGLRSAPAAAIAVYLHTALFGPTVISSFWSLVNERFDPHTGKREIARIAAGATLGGVIGGLAAWRASGLIELPTSLLLLAGLNAACVAGAILVGAPPPLSSERRREPGAGPHASALGMLRRAPYLQTLALLVGLGAATSALLDYIFSAQAVLAYGSGAPLLAYFSLFWLGVSVLSFLLQLSLGRFALQKLGLAVNIAILPGVILLGGAFGLAMPGLASSAILRGSEAVHRNTLFRSAYELLFTPLADEQRRSTKALIDIGFDRLGTVAGSGAVLVALRFFPGHGATFLLGLVLVLALGTLPVTLRLHTGYVAALKQGLKDGAERLSLPPPADPVAPAADAHEREAREKLVEQVEALQPGGLDALLDGHRRMTVVAAPQGAADARGILAQAQALVSGDVARARATLRAWPPERTPLAAFAIGLLGHRELYPDALRALRSMAPLVTGQLIDALVDPAVDYTVRRRLPRVLHACASQRAADGLLLGLDDERFEVRYASGRTLLQITGQNAELVIGAAVVVAAILAEVKRTPETAPLDPEDEEPEEPGGVMGLLVRDRVSRTLEHVFTILSLVLDREPLQIAFQALHHENVRHRGTALEYLETVLPAEVREAVMPLLGDRAPLPAPRPAKEILADLVAAASAAREPGPPGAASLAPVTPREAGEAGSPASARARKVGDSVPPAAG